MQLPLWLRSWFLPSTSSGARRVATALIALMSAGCVGEVDVDLAVFSIAPDVGSAAGGEWVLLEGIGLYEEVVVRFDGVPAPELRVLAAGEVLEVRTPSGIAGPVTVEVERAGTLATASGLFRFTSIAVGYLDYTDAFPAGAADTRAAALVDLDGDNDLDLVRLAADGVDALLYNDGVGNFVATGSLPGGGSNGGMDMEGVADGAVAIGDLNGDGAPDLYLSRAPEPDRVYLNDGLGYFLDVTALHCPACPASRSATLVDVDGDGDADVVLAMDGPDRILTNGLQVEGAGTLAELTAGLPPHPDATSLFTAADVDGDGDPDLVAASNQDGVTLRLYLNPGDGRFVDAPDGQLPGTAAGCHAVLAGDLDGDGAPELLALTVDQNRLYVNDGAGYFFDDTLRALPYDRVDSRAGVLVDVDRDGDLDVVIASHSAANRLFLNGGDGIMGDFTVLLPPDVDPSTDVAVGDVDGDGDLDLVFANDGGEPDRLYLLDASSKGGGL